MSSKSFEMQNCPDGEACSSDPVCSNGCVLFPKSLDTSPDIVRSGASEPHSQTVADGLAVAVLQETVFVQVG